ncbi:MAG TPA: hypothetical protein PKY44_00260 [Bacteroidales bacterium]|jgi:hypothetical protein|nr:hypothetical protein [Bacteroidales bacterium]
MAINISIIESKTNLAASRLLINSNFSALKNGIDNLYSYLDPSTSILNGIKSLTVNDESSSITKSVLNVGNSAQILGNLTIGTSGIDNHITLNGNSNSNFIIQNGDIKIENGNISINGNSYAYGNLYIGTTGNTGGSINLVGLSKSFVSPIDITSETSPYAIQSVSGMQGIVLYNNDNTSDIDIILPLASTNGQELYISYIKGNDFAGDIIIKGNLIDTLGTKFIKMSESGDTIKLIGLSTHWILLNYTSISLLKGLTESSIKII